MTFKPPAGFKPVSAAAVPEGFVLIPADDLANLPPEVQERIRGHRAILAKQNAPSWIPAGPGAMPSPGQEYSPEGAAQVLAQTGANAPGAALAVMGGPMLSAAGKLPGAAGTVGRWMATPVGSGTVAGTEELIRTRSPGRALATGAAVAAGVKGAGVAGRGIGALLNRGTPSAASAAPAAARAARARPVAPPAPPPRPPGATLAARPPGRLPSQQTVSPAQARGGMAQMGEASRSPSSLMRSPSQSGAGAAPVPPSPGAAPAVTPRTIGERMAPQTPIGQARTQGKAFNVPAAPSASQEEAILRLSQKLSGGPKVNQDMARDVIRLRLEGLSMPSKSPGQIADYLSRTYGKEVGGLTPHQARKFADAIVAEVGL